MHSIDIKTGDEVIVPSMTFAATANSIVYQGAKPIFADVNKKNLLIDCENIEAKITKNTKAVIVVDYAGHPVDYDSLRQLSMQYNLNLISDSCHAIGAKYNNKSIGSLADLSTFSFHPVKHITTGEGGAITTNNYKVYKKIKLFRNHGISSDHREREKNGSWFYEMDDIGFNYRINDFQCALGISQLKKLNEWVKKRNSIAKIYDEEFLNNKFIKTLHVQNDVLHAYHLYVIKIDFTKLKIDKLNFFRLLKKNRIGANVHYIPVHLHPFYRKNYKTSIGDCPNSEQAYKEILSIPIYPTMSESDASHVASIIKNLLKENEK